MKIVAFGHTIQDKENIPCSVNLEALRARAAQLHRVGFHKEAGEYDRRARHMHTKITGNAWMAKPRERREFIHHDFSRIPHIAEVKKAEEESRKLSLKIREKVGEAIEKMLVMTDRHAAWDFHQHGHI